MLSQPLWSSANSGPPSGKREFAVCKAKLTADGITAFAAAAARACGVIVSSAEPLRQAATICRAARRESIERSGIPEAIENHANSLRFFPLKDALMCEPVRMRPG